MEAPPSVFQMKVWSCLPPGCSNFRLKYFAAQGECKFNQDMVKFIQCNFYADNGLASVKEARDLWYTGKVCLQKFITNSNKVIATFPKEEYTEGTIDFDLALGEPKIERVLRVQ